MGCDFACSYNDCCTSGTYLGTKVPLHELPLSLPVVGCSHSVQPGIVSAVVVVVVRQIHAAIRPQQDIGTSSSSTLAWFARCAAVHPSSLPCDALPRRVLLQPTQARTLSSGIPHGDPPGSLAGTRTSSSKTRDVKLYPHSTVASETVFR